MVPRIVVVGAGVIGLTSATALQQALPGIEIAIIASSFSPDLTSFVAGGIVRPFISQFTQPELERQVLAASFNHYAKLVNDPESGVIKQSGFDVSAKEKANTLSAFLDFVDGLRDATAEELAEFGPQYKSGWFYSTYGVTMPVFLQFLTDKFTSNGGKFIKKEIDSLAELYEGYDVIVNCTGLGARKLVPDEQVYPLRGQVVRVRCPDVARFFLDDDDYILLTRDYIVLGGCYERDVWSLEVEEATASGILERTSSVCPALKNAEILSHHVGLRPMRDQIRLEREDVTTASGKQITVIHNYGHDGSGVTLSLGCAEHVARLVKEAVEGRR